MQRIALSVILVSATLLIAGCDGYKSALETTSKNMEQGNYESDISVLSQYSDNESTAEMIEKAEFELIPGFWVNSGDSALNGAIVSISLNGDDCFESQLYAVPDNYYGYVSGDILFKEISFENNGIAMQYLHKTIDNESEYIQAEGQLNLESKSIIIKCSDAEYTWVKIQESEISKYTSEYSLLSTGYNGTEFRRDLKPALDMIFSTGEEYQEYVNKYSNYQSTNPFYLEQKSEYTNIVYQGYVMNGAPLTDTIYCGMTLSQLNNPENNLSLVPTYIDIFSSDYVYNGYDITLTFYFSDDVVDHIVFYCEDLKRKADYWNNASGSSSASGPYDETIQNLHDSSDARSVMYQFYSCLNNHDTEGALACTTQTDDTLTYSIQCAADPEAFYDTIPDETIKLLLKEVIMPMEDDYDSYHEFSNVGVVDQTASAHVTTNNISYYEAFKAIAWAMKDLTDYELEQYANEFADSYSGGSEPTSDDFTLFVLKKLAQKVSRSTVVLGKCFAYDIYLEKINGEWYVSGFSDNTDFIDMYLGCFSDLAQNMNYISGLFTS